MHLNLNFIIIIFTIVSSEIYTPIEITTKMGKITGKSKIINGKKLNVFLGIPYAVPPLNELRFKKPIPVKPWNSTLKAFDCPNICYQSDDANFLMQFNPKCTHVSEDCLHLDLYTPMINSDSSVPVMIWMHSGAFHSGSPYLMSTEYSFLTVRANVIIVAIYFRLNAFGFLYAGSDDAPGNVGLYDQLLAFNWVKDNIDSFGGDPKRITIFGSSSGSASVTLHILSPLSRNIFRNAITLSTAALIYRFGADPKIAYNTWVKAAKMVGCGNGVRFELKTIECLRNLSAEKLVKIPKFKHLNGKDEIMDEMPYVVYGNEFLPQKPLIMLKNGEYTKELSLLEGFNNDEGGIFELKFNRMLLNGSTNITFQQANDEMNYIISKLPLKYSINSDDVKKIYFNGISHNNSVGLRQAISKVIGDTQYVCPANEFAKLLFNGDANSRVFQYYFAHKPNHTFEIPNFPWIGVAHPTIAILWFGMPFLYPNLFTDYDRRISDQMMNVLSHFAYYGCPPPQNGIKWEKFYKTNGKVIAPFYEFPSEVNRNGYFGLNIKHVECDILWKPENYS